MSEQGLVERRMRRLLARALMVIGGTAAATAAAFVLSSGTASAETLANHSMAPATADTVNHLPKSASAAEGVHKLVSTVVPVGTSTAQVSGINKADQFKAVTGNASEAADFEKLHKQLDLTFNETSQGLNTAPKDLLAGSLDTLKHVTELPAAINLTDLTSPVKKLIGMSHAVTTERAEQPVAATPNSGAQPVAPAVTSRPDRSQVAQLNYDHLLSTARTMDGLKPGNPVPALPTIPVGAPASCGCGGSAPGSSGGPSFATQPAIHNIFGIASSRALSMNSESMPVKPVKQTGVTPD